MEDTKKSSTDEQQLAELYIADKVEKILGIAIDRNAKVVLEDGVHIEPDIYSEEHKIMGEIYAHTGGLKKGQTQKISQDILKMILLDKCKGVEYRKIFVVADDTVGKYLTGESYIAESIRQFGMEIKRIDLDDQMIEMVKSAQIRQKMKKS